MDRTSERVQIVFAAINDLRNTSPTQSLYDIDYSVVHSCLESVFIFLCSFLNM